MRRISLGRVARALPFPPAAVAAFLLISLPILVRAGQDDPLRAEVVQLGQVTGEDTFEAQVELISQDKDRAKKLIAAAVKMAAAKDGELTYLGALTLAEAAHELKDFKSCEALYRVCMDKAAKLHSQRKVLQAYGGLIEAFYDGKKYGDAVRVCRELLELKTGDGTPRRYFFLIEDATGDFGFKEDPDFDLAKPFHNGIYTTMIQALAKDGKHDQALKLTDNLIRATDSWKDRQLKAWVLREAGRFNEAAKVYEDILERIAKDRELTQSGKDKYTENIRYTLANVYVEVKQIDKATEHYKWLLDRHPDEPGFYNDLGYVWADHDMNLKEAEQLIRKALDLDREKRKKSPKFDPAKDQDKGAYLDSMGWVLFKLKRYEEAKKYLIDALKDKDAQHIEIFDHLGDTYLALGMRDAALDAWRRGLEVVGDDRREQERKQIVEKKIQMNK